MSKKYIIAVLNQKGGVGKTTTAINLSACLAKINSEVLLVDFDPQGNSTSGLGLDKLSSPATAYELLFDSQVLEKSIQDTSNPHLRIVPANANLAAAEMELANVKTRETRLREGLERVSCSYIIIDCPPSLGLLTINALVAADYVLIPVQAEYYALEGLSQLLEVVHRVRQGLNPKLELLGVLLTMYDKRTSLSEQVLGELQKHFAAKLFTTIIPRNVRLAEAPSYGQTIFEHDKWSKGARAYKQLAKEVEQRVKNQ